MRKTKTTSKKVKVIGTQEYVNSTTGEIEQMQVVNIEDRDFNFEKIWLAHILSSIDLIGNQKTKLAFWILENLDGNNRFIGTQRKMSKALNMSTKTVNDTLKLLIESDFLIREQAGVYRINPNVFFKGGHKKRMSILLEYSRQDEINVTPKTKKLTSSKKGEK